jgi:hypothetical protein
MKHFKTIGILVLIMIIMTIMLSADDQEKKVTLGENVLVYKVQYVNCIDLARLLDNYLDRSQGMQVDCIENLNSVVIKAPKESHSILTKLIEEFDNKPMEVDLNIYIVMRFPKKYEAQRTSKTYTFLDGDFNKKLETLNSMNPDIKYEGYGLLTIPLTSRKTIKRSTWSFAFVKDAITYKIEIFAGRITIANNIIMLEDFNVYLLKEKGQHELLLMHSFDIDATSNKLTVTGTSSIFGKNSPEKLELVFWPKIIKD